MIKGGGSMNIITFICCVLSGYIIGLASNIFVTDKLYKKFNRQVQCRKCKNLLECTLKKKARHGDCYCYCQCYEGCEK